MEYTIEQILNWEKCNCGRGWCLVFDGGIGEYGESLSRHELEYTVTSLKEQKHYKKSSIDKAVKKIEDILK